MEVIKNTELDTELSKLMIHDGIRNMKSKYQLPDAFSGKPKNKNIKFENVADMYNPDACMVSCKTSIDRLPAGFLAFERRYWEQLECLEVNWIDFRRKDEDSKELIQIELINTAKECKIFTISIHLSTGCITCQGTGYKDLANFEFPRLLNLVQKLTSRKGRERPETIPKEIVDEINDSQDSVSEIFSSPQQTSSKLEKTPSIFRFHSDSGENEISYYTTHSQS